MSFGVWMFFICFLDYFDVRLGLGIIIILGFVGFIYRSFIVGVIVINFSILEVVGKLVVAYFLFFCVWEISSFRVCNVGKRLEFFDRSFS